jgi:hypothetical protein
MRYASSGAKDGEAIPYVRQIDIRDCTFEKLTKNAVVVEGWSPAARITDVTIQNCRFPEMANPYVITNAARIQINGKSL